MKERTRASDKRHKTDSVFVIRRTFARPHAGLVARFSKLPTANLSDASGSLNTMDSGIQAVTPRARLCGPACTVSTRAGDFVTILMGLNVAQPGDVLVISNNGS